MKFQAPWMYGAASSSIASSPPRCASTSSSGTMSASSIAARTCAASPSASFTCTSMPNPPDYAKLPTSITARRGHRKRGTHPVEASAEPDGGAIDPVLETRSGDHYDQGEAGERDGDCGRIRQDARQRDKTRAAKGEQNRKMQQVDAERQPAKHAAWLARKQPLRSRPEQHAQEQCD